VTKQDRVYNLAIKEVCETIYALDCAFSEEYEIFGEEFNRRVFYHRYPPKTVEKYLTDNYGLLPHEQRYVWRKIRRPYIIKGLFIP
jgi:hypothetical protein